MYADKTIFETNADASTKLTNPDGSTEEKFASGGEMNGHEIHTMADGAIREIHADDGLIEVEFPLGVPSSSTATSCLLYDTVNCSLDATLTRGLTHSLSHAAELLAVPLQGASPGGEEIKWPKIKTAQKPAEGAAKAAHYYAADGTDIQANPDGTLIVTWKQGASSQPPHWCCRCCAARIKDC